MIYFEIKNKDGEIVASNIKNFNFLDKFNNEKNQKVILSGKEIKSGFEEFDFGSVWLIAENEKDLFKSSKFFKKTMKIYGCLSRDFLLYYINKIKNHSHTLKNLQGQMKQKVEGLITDNINNKCDNYEEFKRRVKEEVAKDTDSATDIICYLNKRIFDIDAHIESFEILSLGSRKEINYSNHNVRKVLLHIAQPFLENFKQNGVTLKFDFDDNFAESNKLLFDYKIFNLAIYNFFDNAVKYSKPYSYIKIYFEKKSNFFCIKFEMYSLRIEKDELEKVFQEGYSGRNAGEEAGDGIGMFEIEKALKLNNMEMIIIPDYSKSENLDEKMYIFNTFEIKNIN